MELGKSDFLVGAAVWVIELFDRLIGQYAVHVRPYPALVHRDQHHPSTEIRGWVLSKAGSDRR